MKKSYGQIKRKNPQIYRHLKSDFSLLSRDFFYNKNVSTSTLNLYDKTDSCDTWRIG